MSGPDIHNGSMGCFSFPRNIVKTYNNGII